MLKRMKVVLSTATAGFLLALTASHLAGDGMPAKVSFSPTDSFRTRAFRLPSFKLADGSVHPTAMYSLKAFGTGKPGEVSITILDIKANGIGKIPGKVKGRPSNPGSEKGFDPQPEPPVKFSHLNLTPASEVKVVPQGAGILVQILGRGAAIEAELSPLSK